MAEGNPTIKSTTGACLSRGTSFCEKSHPMDELNGRPSFASPSERHGDVSETSTIHGNHPSDDAWTPNRPDEGSSPERGDAGVLVIDWDGPDDPNDPKK